MYHLIGADVSEGLRTFERLCRLTRQQLRFAECAALIKLVHDYDAILTESQHATVSYHEAKLASDTRDWPTAERLLRGLADSRTVDTALRVKSHLRLGYVLAQQGSLEAALAACERARNLAEAGPTASAIMPRILHELGVTYRDLGEQETASRLLRESSERSASRSEWNGFAIAQNSLGGLYLKQQLAVKAIEAFRSALDRLDLNQDPLRVSQVYNNIALAYMEQRDWTEAQEWFGKSLEIKQKAGDVLGQALAFNNLLRVHIAKDEFESAVKMAAQATHYFQLGGDLGRAALAQQNLAKAYRRLGKVQQARDCYNEAIRLFSNKGDRSAVDALRAEMAALDVHVGLPWWAWVVMVLTGLFFLLLVVGIVALIMDL
jgi:tetratricopeptide (TPR) repeat protein